MKKYLILLLLAAVCGPLSAQTKHEVHDFYSLMTAVPVDEESSSKSFTRTDSMIIVKTVTYKNRETTPLAFIKPEKRLRETYKRIGPEIDSLGIIDYKSDTVFMVKTADIFSDHVPYMMITTDDNTIAFDSAKNPLVFSRIERPEESFYLYILERYIIHKYRLEAYADWSEEKFIKLLERFDVVAVTEGGYEVSTRYIIKDNCLVRKDMFFYDILFMTDDDIIDYWKTNILPNKGQ